MSPKEQAKAVKLLKRWRDLAKAAKRMPADKVDRLELLGLFDELLAETDAFVEHEDPDE